MQDKHLWVTPTYAEITLCPEVFSWSKHVSVQGSRDPKEHRFAFISLSTRLAVSRRGIAWLASCVLAAREKGYFPKVVADPHLKDLLDQTDLSRIVTIETTPSMNTADLDAVEDLEKDILWSVLEEGPA